MALCAFNIGLVCLLHMALFIHNIQKCIRLNMTDHTWNEPYISKQHFVHVQSIRHEKALHILVSIDIGRRCIHKDLNKHEQSLAVVCVCLCVCGVCVTCTYSGVDMHPSMCCVRVYVYVVCA